MAYRLLAAPVLALLLALPAQASIVSSHINEAQYMALLDGPYYTCAGRIGNGPGGTYELFINDGTIKDQYNWLSGVEVPWSIVYDDGTRLLRYTVGARSLTYATAAAPSEIFITTSAKKAGTSMTVEDLYFNGAPLSGSSAAAGSNSLDILWLSGFGDDLLSGFTLAGTARMAWAGARPSASQLAYAIVFDRGIAIPAPSAAALAALGAAVTAFAGAMRRRTAG
jgi:hypothetical protein